jgi:hypothetical protein
MIVTDTGDCFLNPDALINERSFLTIQVDRKDDGFHVVIIARETTWERGRTSEFDAIPVLSIRKEYDPDLPLQPPIDKLAEES